MIMTAASGELKDPAAGTARSAEIAEYPDRGNWACRQDFLPKEMENLR